MFDELFYFISEEWRSKLPLPTTADKQVLTETTIGENSPGKILQDFQILLDFLQPQGVEVSSGYYLLSLKYLEELNQKLSHPIATNLKRPQQKSYPYIHGLYFLLRTSGLSQVVNTGTKTKLVIDAAALEIWQTLNPTERYFTLLEAWLIWGNGQILGRDRDPFGSLYYCLNFWTKISEDSWQIASYKEQDKLVYYYGEYNLFLLHLFGLIDLQLGTPEPGKGFRIVSLTKLPWGKAVIAMMSEVYRQMPHDRGEPEAGKPDFRIAFEKLKPFFTPFFPEWQQTLVIWEGKFSADVHIFKIWIARSWRRVALPGNLTLDEVAAIIVEAFNFNWGHLYRFLLKDSIGNTTDISHPFTELPPFTDCLKLGDLALSPNSQLTFVYDLLEEWEFKMILENIVPLTEENQEPMVLDRYGSAPEPYEW